MAVIAPKELTDADTSMVVAALDLYEKSILRAAVKPGSVPSVSSEYRKVAAQVAQLKLRFKI